MSLRSPLGNVLGLGSARQGSQHWWAQRVSAVALVPLSFWFVTTVLSLPTSNYAMVRLWLNAPINGFLSILLIAVVAHHSYLGTCVIIEDYVASTSVRIVSLLALKFAHVFLGGAAIFAILQVVFRTAGT